MFSKQGPCCTFKIQHVFLHHDRQMSIKPCCPCSTSEDSMSHACSLTQWGHVLTNYQDSQKQAEKKQHCLGLRAFPGYHFSYCHVYFGAIDLTWLQKHFSGEMLSHMPVLFPCLNRMNIYCSHLHDGKRRAEAQEAFHFTWQLLVSATKSSDVDWIQGTSQFCDRSWPPIPEKTVFLHPFHPEAATSLMTGAVTLGEQLRWELQSSRLKRWLALGVRRQSWAISVLVPS